MIWGSEVRRGRYSGGGRYIWMSQRRFMTIFNNKLFGLLVLYTQVRIAHFTAVASFDALEISIFDNIDLYTNVRNYRQIV
jgi:hypothetical protein